MFDSADQSFTRTSSIDPFVHLFQLFDARQTSFLLLLRRTVRRSLGEQRFLRQDAAARRMLFRIVQMPEGFAHVFVKFIENHVVDLRGER